MLCDNLREVGWGRWKEAQEGGDICAPMAGSCCCTAETSTTLWSNYPPIKSKLRIFFTAICSVSCSVVCLILCDFMDCSLSGSCPWDSPGKNTGVGCHSLLQGTFLTQGLNPVLLYYRRILYHLSHQGSPSTCNEYTKKKKLLTRQITVLFSTKSLNYSIELYTTAY